MFNKKNYLTPITIMTIYFQKQTTVFFNDKFNSNIINIKNNLFFNTPLNFLNEFSKTYCCEIAANDLNFFFQTNNLFYNYKWDFYLNFINKNTKQNSLFIFYNNRLWLEREVCEFFPINFLNSKDSRNLLLNYNDNIKYLIKKINVQTNSELKTSWHLKKIFKTKNINIEL